jgi:hypothetical protein
MPSDVTWNARPAADAQSAHLVSASLEKVTPNMYMAVAAA